MKKAFLRDIEANLRIRVKDDVMLEFYYGWLYVIIATPDRLIFWVKVYFMRDLDGLSPQEIGRLVKDDYVKFIISQHVNC